jgi:hypothetical protein
MHDVCHYANDGYMLEGSIESTSFKLRFKLNTNI